MRLRSWSSSLLRFGHSPGCIYLAEAEPAAVALGVVLAAVGAEHDVGILVHDLVGGDLQNVLDLGGRQSWVGRDHQRGDAGDEGGGAGGAAELACVAAARGEPLSEGLVVR